MRDRLLLQARKWFGELLIRSPKRRVGEESLSNQIPSLPQSAAKPRPNFLG